MDTASVLTWAALLLAWIILFATIVHSMIESRSSKKQIKAAWDAYDECSERMSKKIRQVKEEYAHQSAEDFARIAALRGQLDYWRPRGYDADL